MPPERWSPGSDATAGQAGPEPPLLDRREFLGRLGLAGAGLVLGASLLHRTEALAAFPALGAHATPAEAARAAHRYLEFAAPGEAPRHLGASDPFAWRIRVDGLIERPRALELGDLVRDLPLEERRVPHHLGAAVALPWTGFPLAALVRWAVPSPSARFVRVVSFVRPDLAPNQARATCYPWPYREGLSLEDAMDSRAFVAMGLGARALPLLDGAPLRLVLPWKRGCKCSKGIVRFEFTDRQPGTFRGELVPRAYAFDGGGASSPRS